MKWFLLVAGILANASASLLIKFSSLEARKSVPAGASGWTFLNWPLWLGILCYAVAFVIFVIALQLFPASIAHPVITAGAIAMVTILASVLLGESLTAMTWLGVLAIIGGVVLVSAGSRP